MGTVAYMSPAVAAGQAEDTRCDIYSFGAVLREMLTGRPPYVGRTVSELSIRSSTTPSEPIASVNPHAHPGLTRIAEGAMARDLRDRYATMNDVIADLDRVAHGLEPIGPHARPGIGLHRRLIPRVVPGNPGRPRAGPGASPRPLYRRLSAGDLDPTFGTGQGLHRIRALGRNCPQVLVQPDGKIVAVGMSSTTGRRHSRWCDTTPRGDLDGRFGDGGEAFVDLGEGKSTRPSSSPTAGSSS